MKAVWDNPIKIFPYIEWPQWTSSSWRDICVDMQAGTSRQTCFPGSAKWKHVFHPWRERCHRDTRHIKNIFCNETKARIPCRLTPSTRSQRGTLIRLDPRTRIKYPFPIILKIFQKTVHVSLLSEGLHKITAHESRLLILLAEINFLLPPQPWAGDLNIVGTPSPNYLPNNSCT